jgi:uncharacterized BrkB/YihY/UPF0761 family membrane protein
MHLDARSTEREGDLVRTVLLVVAAGLAAAVTGFVALVAHALTAEYGTTPNRGGAGETVGWTAQIALPATFVVTVLLYAASSRWPLAPRRRLVVGGAVAALLVVSVAVLVGSCH